MLHRYPTKTFVTAPNKFTVMGAHDAMVMASGVLKTLAVSLYKIANDIRLLASGPRSGIGELIIPANEPGSSIMPGKVNPTQVEALTMVCCQVMGNDTTITFAGANGHFELNVTIPLIAYSLHESIQCLARGADTFATRCVAGLEANEAKIEHYLKESLMLVTALNPHIGYDNAAKVAKTAFAEGKTLREVVLEKKLLSAKEVDKALDPKTMI
jgi:fumarate hydratase class II